MDIKSLQFPKEKLYERWLHQNTAGGSTSPDPDEIVMRAVDALVGAHVLSSMAGAEAKAGVKRKLSYAFCLLAGFALHKGLDFVVLWPDTKKVAIHRIIYRITAVEHDYYDSFLTEALCWIYGYARSKLIDLEEGIKEALN